MTRHRALASTTSLSTPRSTLARVVSQHPTLVIATTIVALTAAAAVASAVWLGLGPGRQPHPTLHGTPGEVASIFVTNARTLIAPLLLAAGRWHTGRTTRHVGDVVVAALVISNPVMVGLALGRHPIELLAYLPHLPLEDAALAIAASAWVARRIRRGDDSPPASVARCASIAAAVVLLAAIVETYAVPHASSPGVRPVAMRTLVNASLVMRVRRAGQPSLTACVQQQRLGHARSFAHWQGLTEGLTKGLIVDEASVPGSPCKCTPLSPAASPWGLLSISRGIPGPVVSPVEVEVEKEGKEEEETATAKTKADDRGLGLGGCAWTRRVIADAIGQRFATSGIADEGAGAR